LKKLFLKFYFTLFIGEKKKRSEVWNYFKLIKNKEKTEAKCCFKKVDNEICGKLLTYHNNTTSLRNHLKTHEINFESKQDKNKLNNGTSIIDLNYFLMMFIITAGLPFQCVENKYFKKYSEGLKSTYKMPNRRKISNLVNNYYEKKKKRVEEKLGHLFKIFHI
jgi:hypothetical protein